MVNQLSIDISLMSELDNGRISIERLRYISIAGLQTAIYEFRYYGDVLNSLLPSETRRTVLWPPLTRALCIP